MKVQVDGVVHDYYSFRLYMTYYMNDDGLRMLYGVLGRRKGEYGKVEEDCIKSFSTPEEAAMYHFELEKQLEAEHEACLKRIDRMPEEDGEDMDTIPFAPSSSASEREQEAFDLGYVPIPSGLEEEAYVDTEICSSS